MATSAERVGANTIVQAKRFFDLRRPKALVEAIKGGTAEASSDTPLFNLSGLGNPLGSCSIGIEGSWNVSFSTSMTREALRRAGKPDSKPVTGTGTYRNGEGSAEENVTLKVVRSAEGLVTVTLSGEPTYPNLIGKKHAPDFALIPPTTLSFQSVTPSRGVGGSAN